jgi:tetratricopeptide (TPR) repeat protein
MSTMEEEIGALLSRANLARVRGNLAEAQTICQSALELSPTSADAHSLLGDLFAAQEKHDEALHCYSVAADLRPQSVPLREKRDKAILARHSRLLSSQQQQAQVPAPAKALTEKAAAVKEPASDSESGKRRPRWLVAVLVGVGGIVMLLLGIWLGTSIAHRNDLVPTKVPATVGRKTSPG